MSGQRVLSHGGGAGISPFMFEDLEMIHLYKDIQVRKKIEGLGRYISQRRIFQFLSRASKQIASHSVGRGAHPTFVNSNLTFAE